MEEGFIVSAATIQKAGMLTGRQLVLLVVIGLHALVIASLMAMKISIDDSGPPTVFKPITRVDAEDPPPPPPPQPTIEPTVMVPRWQPPDLAPPQITTQTITLPPIDFSPGLVAETPVAPVDDGALVEVPETALQYRATRSPDDYYPAVSLRLQEQGDAVVRVCVGPSGRREGSPVIERSSGSRHLDGAAVKWASEALAFTPATRNGSPVTACKGFRVSFTLR